MAADESVGGPGPVGLPRADEISHERPLWLNQRLADASGEGIRVAIIDSGLVADGVNPHRDARAFIGPGDGFELRQSADVVDCIGHGTAIAGIVNALAPRAEIVPLRVFGSRLETSPEIIAAALDWAADRAVEVVNLSLGSTMEAARRPLQKACRRAHEAGCLLISAVPRGAEQVFPAAFREVIGVTAGRYSNAYDLDALPQGTADFAAQGFRQYSWQGRPQESFGSSMAAPHLTALVALLKEKLPKANVDGVRTLLRELAAASRSARSL